MDKLLLTGLRRLCYGAVLCAAPLFTHWSRGLWFGLTLALIALAEGLSWWFKGRKNGTGTVNLLTAVLSLVFALLLCIPAAVPLTAWLVTLYMACLAVLELVTWLKMPARRTLLYSGIALVVLTLATRLPFMERWVTLLLSLALIFSGVCRLAARAVAPRKKADPSPAPAEGKKEPSAPAEVKDSAPRAPQA